ncbi:MAG TPA: poly(R)-hydroxyalkanoic acid synthase subunit PhaE [Steroidobacteraceae bacterium]|nr:poly(R)-hydroxyalkanoic acid synthase subunit PhaE [Steroidobacteraceae bacterium]
MNQDANPATAWASALGQLQQDIMRQWQQTTRPPAEASAAPTPWTPFAMPGLPGMMGLPGAPPPPPPPATPSFAAWDQYFKFSQSIADQFQKLSGAGADATAQAREFASAMDNWFQKLGGSNPLMAAFGQMVPQFPQANAQGPALGMLREHQQAWQRLSQATQKLQQQQAELSALWSKVGQSASQRFGDEMKQRLSADKPFSSVMEVYNLWVECAEECYARVAHSPEYGLLIAALTNTVQELRLEQQRQAESWARQLDLPMRSEVNELHRQIRELKAELAAFGGPGSPRRGDRGG